MIICHCMSITRKDIHAAVNWMRAADPDTLITPGKVYRALGKKAERNYNEKKHEAPKLAEEARIELELAQLNFEARLEQIKA